MRQFIPFEDEWDVFAQLRPEDLVPYQVGLVPSRDGDSQRAAGKAPSISSTSPACTPMRWAVPAANSST